MYVYATRFMGACMLLLLSNSAAASDPPTQLASISLEDSIARTLADNPELRAFGYQLTIDRSLVQQAGLPPNPDLLVTVEGALGTGDHTGFESAETTVSLGWVFERALRESRVDTAMASESLTAADIEILRVEAAAETASRFLDLLAYQAHATTAKDAVELAGQTVDAVQRRVDANRAAEADLARAQAALAFAELDQEDIRHELSTARHRLAAQWGSTRPDFLEAQGNLYQLPTTLPLSQLNMQAEQNPMMRRYLSKQRLDEVQIRLAEAQRKPGWKGVLGLRRFESTDDVALVTGFTIPLTLRNRNQGNIAAAQAAAEQTFAQAVATRVEIETTLYVFYAALQHSLLVATTLRDEVIPLVNSALTETRAAYESGRYSYFDWQSVQAELIEARNALTEASIEAHRNVIEIERLTGTRLALEGTAP